MRNAALVRRKPIDFHTSNIQRARTKRHTPCIVRSGNPILWPPEGRSLRDAPSVNSTQKQYAFSAHKRYFVLQRLFSPHSFLARQKRMGRRSKTRASGADKIWRRRHAGGNELGAFRHLRRLLPAPAQNEAQPHRRDGAGGRFEPCRRADSALCDVPSCRLSVAPRPARSLLVRRRVHRDDRRAGFEPPRAEDSRRIRTRRIPALPAPGKSALLHRTRTGILSAPHSRPLPAGPLHRDFHHLLPRGRNFRRNRRNRGHALFARRDRQAPERHSRHSDRTRSFFRLDGLVRLRFMARTLAPCMDSHRRHCRTDLLRW